MSDGLIIMLIFIGMYLGCYLIALPITKRRKLWARRMVIGKDSEERQEELRNFARDIILEKKIPDEMEDIETTIIKEGNKITSVRMETKRTLITLKPGGETNILNKGFSEKGATGVVALCLWAVALILLLFIITISLILI